MQAVSPAPGPSSAADRARFVRAQMPAEGLFAGHNWRVSPGPFPLSTALTRELETLGRVLLQFYRAVNLLYRKSAEGKEPEWIPRWLVFGEQRHLTRLTRAT